MTVRALLEEFEMETNIAVDRKRIVEWVQNNSRYDTIEFIKDQKTGGALLGHVQQYVHHSAVYGDPTYHAQIYFDGNLPDPWVNLVCVAGLVQLVSKRERPMTLDDIHAEIEANVQAPGYNDQTLNREYYAASAVILPFAARSAFLEANLNRAIPIERLSRHANLPIEYTRLVMSDRWDEIYRGLKGTV